jgi:hypothetical protein
MIELLYPSSLRRYIKFRQFDKIDSFTYIAYGQKQMQPRRSFKTKKAEPMAEPIAEPIPESIVVPVAPVKKRVLKTKKPDEPVMAQPMAQPMAEPIPEPIVVPVAQVKKRTMKTKKPDEPVMAEPMAQPIAEPVKKRTMKTKKPEPLLQQSLPIITEPITLAKQAFLNLIDYYKEKDLPVPAEDIKWYEEELLREKKEDDEFWERCAVTKACMEGVLRGDDEWTIQLAENAARQKVKALPIQESDLGPMPEYGSNEFWAWCNKKKKLKEQKDAAIIAAGGTVKQTKPKVKKSQK